MDSKAEGTLGVNIEQDQDDSFTLTQTGLTTCSSFSTATCTPAERSPLSNDSSRAPATGTFNYASVVGILLYQCGQTHPNIAFAVHQCVRYTFCPTMHHELALICIGWYLKGTMDKDLVLSPYTPCINCYPDDAFASLYGHEDSQDPHCSHSCTSYLITMFN